MKIRPELANHPLAKASREVNAYAEKNALRQTCEHYGFKPDDLAYIAEQRALRALAASYGRNLNLQRVDTWQLSESEIQTLAVLTSAYMDGLLIGWRAKEISLTYSALS